MSNLDLDRLKAALSHDVFHESGGPWKARHFTLMWNEDAAEAIVAILNATPALIAEVERLERELANAKAVGAVEELERMAGELSPEVHPFYKSWQVEDMLSQRAAELRKGIK